MSGKPAARLGDPTACPHTGHGSNPLVQGSPDVLFDSRPAARQGDTSACGGALSAGLIPNVLINGRPAAVVGSQGAHGNLVTAGSGSVFIGTVTAAGFPLSLNEPSNPPVNLAPPTDSLARAWREEPSDPAPLDLEEEEEEEETERPARQGITLRIGVFFDGTGNNLANAALTEQCRREDLELFDAEQLRDISNHCQVYGYSDLRGGHFERLPADSYANAESNVARLYGLYRDDSFRTLEKTEKSAVVKAYLEGVGTSSGDSDSLYGQGTGLGDTGVVARVARVAQSPAEVGVQLDKLRRQNPDLKIETLEFDVFGFSRGAAAARHFANEVLKSGGGVLAETLNARMPGFSDSFDWAADARINFIGLFDCVAAIVNLARGDLSPANEDNPGVNLYLPAACARKVIQLTAADERRHNFVLNSVAPDHQEIALPGAHADIGGGYGLRERERYILSRPRHSTVMPGSDPYRTAAYRQTLAELPAWEALGLTGLRVDHWVRPQPPASHGGGPRLQSVYAAVVIEREVRGELSLIYLRVMRDLSVVHGVPLMAIPDTPRYSLPAELEPVMGKLLAHARGEKSTLAEAEVHLLWRRYIHLSANWTPRSGLLVNKPADNGRRVFANLSQSGYPE